MIQYIGTISREKVNELYGKSRLGLLLYQPAQNHYEAQPIKMFEYMAAGLPFVASNFALWKSIVEKNECGICVDETDPKAVREAILWLLNHPAESKRIAVNGRRAVEQEFNWNIEEKKLFELYEEILAECKG